MRGFFPRAQPLFGGPGPWPPTIKQEPFDLPPETDTQQTAVWAGVEWPLGSGRMLAPLVRTLPTDPTLLGFRPDRPDRKWFRGRFGGVRVPGLPWADFGSSAVPETQQTWFLPWFERRWWDKTWDIYQGEYGLTHFPLSIPQARNQGFLDDRLVDCARAAHSRGLYVSMNAWGGDGPNVETWDEIRGWLERMKDAITWVNYLWQHDKWMGELDTSSGLTPLDGLEQILTEGLWCARNGKLHSDHWMSADGAWPDADDSPRAPYSTWTRYGVRDRFDWQAILGSPDNRLDRICRWLGDEHREMEGQKYQHAHLMQYTPYDAPINAMQEAHVKAFQATAPHGILVVGGEYEHNAEFDQRPFPPRRPVHGNQKGFAICCAQGYGQTSSGYNDGGSLPDGRFL